MRALGHCDPHYRQLRKHGALSPLHSYVPARGENARARISLRVSRLCRVRILADVEGARTLLERWAREHK